MNKVNTYQVCATNDEVYVSIKDRACYLNCAPLRSFLKDMVEDGKLTFVIDFQNCSGADSTFLGILVGLALKLKKSNDGGSLNLVNLIGRNLETVQNLGIHKIANVSSSFVSSKDDLEILKIKIQDEKECQQEIYNAHKTLLELNEKNSRIFRDVINFMEQKVEDSR